MVLPAAARPEGAGSEQEDLLVFFDQRELSIANLLTTPVDRAPAVATVIPASEMKAMGARSLLDVLRRVPGFGVGMASYPVFNSIEVRGVRTLFSEKILVMVDGQRMNQILHGGATPFLEWFPVAAVKRLEIVRGPGSALHGSDAFLATLNIVTKTPADTGPLSVSTGLGSDDTKHLHVAAGRESEPLDWVGFADLFTTDGPSYRITGDKVGQSGSPLTWADSRTAGLSLRWGDVVLRSGLLLADQGPYIGATYILNDESRWGQHAFWNTLSWRRQAGGNLEIGARIYSNFLDQDEYWELMPAGIDAAFPTGMIGNPISKNWSYGAETMATRSWGNHRLTGVLQFEQQKQYDVRHRANYNPISGAALGFLRDISAEYNFNQDASRTLWAFSLQDVWQLRDSVALTAGLRHDVYSDFGSTTNPRLGLVWEAMEKTVLKFLYGTAFRAPVFVELYHSNNPSILGNHDLEPESIQTWELALEHEFARGYTLSANIYRNEIDQLVVEVPASDGPGRYQNDGRVLARGLELAFDARFNPALRGRLSYSYQHPTDRDTGAKLPDVPSHRTVLGVDFFGLSPFELHADFFWTGERPRASGDPRPPLGDTLLTDLSISSGRLFQHAELRATVRNLFDTGYHDPSPSALLVDGDYPGKARSFSLEFNYRF